MKTELEKFGANVSIDSESLRLRSGKTMTNDISVDTYNDHRMAMAFAPLALKGNFGINDAQVVSKSYPDFWNDLKTLGFNIQQV